MKAFRQEQFRLPAERPSPLAERTGGGVGGPAWIVAQLEQGIEDFRLWLEQYLVASCSHGVGSACGEKEDLTEVFPLPERPADAAFVSPESDAYPPGSMVCQWWQEGDVCLGVCISTDPVMGLEHMRWYRVPKASIHQYESHPKDEGPRSNCKEGV